MSAPSCPRCGAELDRDEADVGVGVIYGPASCPACHWDEERPDDVPEPPSGEPDADPPAPPWELPSDADFARFLLSLGVGSKFRCSPSALLSGAHVSHATDASGERTLCGRDASRWPSDPAALGGPDCLRCSAVWERRGADAAHRRAVSRELAS